MPDEGAKAEDIDASAVLDGTRDIGGYTFSRWRGEEWGTFAEWIRDQREAQARKSMASAEGLTAASRADLIAQRREAPVSFADCHRWLNTPDGFKRAMLLAFRVKHPRITQAQVNEIEIETGGTYGFVKWMLGLGSLPDAGSSSRQEADSPPTEGEAGSA